MEQVNSYQGIVGIGLRELSEEENFDICVNLSNYNETFKSLPNKPLNFTSNFGLRLFTSGCYYYDLIENKWLSYGVEVLEETNILETHCISYHLTEFAGGFIVLPSSIDFAKVWANASFLQNPIIYSTVIIIIALYIFLALITRYLDIRDSKKIGYSVIDNLSENYFYELRVYTGSRKDSETDSKVS